MPSLMSLEFSAMTLGHGHDEWLPVTVIPSANIIARWYNRMNFILFIRDRP